MLRALRGFGGFDSHALAECRMTKLLLSHVGKQTKNTKASNTHSYLNKEPRTRLGGPSSCTNQSFCQTESLGASCLYRADLRDFMGLLGFASLGL